MRVRKYRSLAFIGTPMAWEGRYGYREDYVDLDNIAKGKMSSKHSNPAAGKPI
jgi:hypothetical protein